MFEVLEGAWTEFDKKLKSVGEPSNPRPPPQSSPLSRIVARASLLIPRRGCRTAIASLVLSVHVPADYLLWPVTGDLDELIDAHQHYIDTMLRKALLDDATQLTTVSITPVAAVAFFE